MALITLQYPSEALMKFTTVYLIIPESCFTGRNLSSCQAVYLLHGLSEDGSSWIRRTNAESYAMERGIVLILPSGDRSMYCDDILGQNYFTFITDELPAYLEQMFGLSRKREQNSIAGFSMGGYGASRAALNYPDHYRVWGSFSGPLDLEPLLLHVDDEMNRCFPFLLKYAKEIGQTPFNPINLLDRSRQMDLNGYIVCGTEDDLLLCTRLFQDRSDSIGAPNHFIYPEGAHHDWTYCDSQLPGFLDFVLEVNS